MASFDRLTESRWAYPVLAAIVFFLPFKKSKIYLFGSELVSQTFSNAVGVPLIAVAQGLCGWAAYLISGLPQAGFWAIITGFASIIPIVGTAIIWVPAGVYMIVVGHPQAGIFILGSVCMMGNLYLR